MLSHRLESLFRACAAMTAVSTKILKTFLTSSAWRSMALRTRPRQSARRRAGRSPTPDRQSDRLLEPESLSENRRGLAHFAVPWEQNVPVPLSSAGSRIGSKSATAGAASGITETIAAGDAEAAHAVAAEPATPAPANLHPARRVDSVRLSAESLDRLLKCSGQLLTTCLQQDGLALDLQGLVRDITECKNLCGSWRGAAAEREIDGPSNRLPDSSPGRFSNRASIARRGELVDHQLLALGKTDRHRPSAAPQCLVASVAHRTVAPMSAVRMAPPRISFNVFAK